MWNFIANITGWKSRMSPCYDEGWDAYFDGANWIDNPYQEGVYAHAQWEMGWLAAEDAYTAKAVSF
jgi:hypothetical protein